MSEISVYYDTDAIACQVAHDRHRDAIGGLWDEIGRLQFDFLCAHGLSPSSVLVDIGCGCLRGGVHFVYFLNSGNYFGVDVNEALLEAGYDIELRRRGLCDRLARGNLICDGEFQFSKFPTTFDIGIAQSLFTHLPANHIQLCLARLAPKMRPGGRLFATFFLVPDDHPIGLSFDHPQGICTFDHKDPYHYRFKQLRHLCDGLPWCPTLIGHWGHPRDQQMVLFRPIAGQAEDALDPVTRALDIDDAAALPAGAAHYRAYVGPPDRYDFSSASQFSLLFSLGLRDNHQVLDFGCGSLRLGRLLIPFLRSRRYFGIEPNRWLIDDGIDRELGRDIIKQKQPLFSYNDDFKCDVFGTKFDYIIAQSILTHCGADVADMLLQSMRATLEHTGKILFSIIRGNSPFEKPQSLGWTYPSCVSYGDAEISAMCKRARLECVPIPWYHPGAVWYAAAHTAEQLPSTADLWLLMGAVLFDPQFKASRSLGRT